MSLLLSKEQIDAGSQVVFLNDNKLTASQITDLLSIFRGYLGPLAAQYPLRATLEAEQDTQNGDQRCAKLVACLTLFQENQFTPASGFAPTVANRTGFNFSADGEVYEFFKYAFGLFWDIPAELELKFNSLSQGGSGSFQQGAFTRVP